MNDIDDIARGLISLGLFVAAAIMLGRFPVASAVVFLALFWYAIGDLLGRALGKNRANILDAKQAWMQEMEQKEAESASVRKKFHDLRRSLLQGTLNEIDGRITELREYAGQITELAQQFHQKLLYAATPEEIFPIREFRETLTNLESMREKLTKLNLS